MKFFFFGTLRDDDVLRLVVGRPVPAADLLDASLPGYRTVRARGQSFPILERAPDDAAPGRIVRHLHPPEIARLLYFESEYAIRRLRVLPERGPPVSANVFIAGAGLQSSGEPWDLPAWTRLHKHAFVASARRMMATHAMQKSVGAA